MYRLSGRGNTLFLLLCLVLLLCTGCTFPSGETDKPDLPGSTAESSSNSPEEAITEYTAEGTEIYTTPPELDMEEAAEIRKKQEEIPETMEIGGILYWDSSSQYLGFDWDPDSYRRVDAIERGYVLVTPYSTLGIESGREILEEFIENSSQGIPGVLHMVEENTTLEGQIIVRFRDVLFDGTYYYGVSFPRPNEDPVPIRKYRYLRILNGRTPNAGRNTEYGCLTDIPDLSFEEYDLAQLNYPYSLTNLSTYRFYSYQYPLE